MSKLVVEVCQISKVSPHPNADKLDVIQVKGWDTIISKGTFKTGDKCIFFPPDSVLQPELYNSPNDPITPGRLNNSNYLKTLPTDFEGNKPSGKRVTACRLRGSVSYGLAIPLDLNYGDLDWDVGTDVSEFFKVTKYEPPVESVMGECEKFNSRFYPYKSIEHYANFTDLFQDQEEVIFTEKVHGTNSRVGLILEPDSTGHSQWTYAAGSHSVRRKELSNIETRILASKLEEKNIKILKKDDVSYFKDENGIFWMINQEIPSDIGMKYQVVQVNSDFELIKRKSDYWLPLTENMKNLLNYLKDNFKTEETMHSIMIYGEIYGFGVQDMCYGLNCKSYKAFDIAINNIYLDYDYQIELFNKFDIEVVPVLYRGPFSQEKVKEFATGPTTICDTKNAGKFKGREGIVIKSVIENKMFNKPRKIAKSVSADYLSRENGTEFH